MINSLISHRHLRKFYLSLFGVFVFFILMSFFILGLFIHLYNSNYFETRNYGLIPLFLAFVIGFIYVLYRYIIFAPLIEVNKDFIKLNSSIYYWKDLEKIELTGKRNFLLFIDREGTLLKFKNQKPRIFLDSMYSNSSQIKNFIQCVVIDRSNFITEITPPQAKELAGEKLEKYARCQLFNYRGIVLWGIAGLIMYGLVINGHKTGLLIFLVIIGLSFTSGLSWYFYYFKLSENYLVIRNSNFFWWNKIYRLSDIKEIVFERGDKMPTSLRVIQKDFDSELFPAAALWGKDWRQLKAALEKKNIPVRLDISIGQD